MGVYGLSGAHVEYLLAACALVGDSTEQQVDATHLRREADKYLAHGEERAAQKVLAHRGYITTKGAGKPPVGFFWITDKGLEVAEEARKHGWAWPPRE